jgi:hypothetical protein
MPRRRVYQRGTRPAGSPGLSLHGLPAPTDGAQQLGFCRLSLPGRRDRAHRRREPRQRLVRRRFGPERRHGPDWRTFGRPHRGSLHLRAAWPAVEAAGQADRPRWCARRLVRSCGGAERGQRPHRRVVCARTTIRAPPTSSRGPPTTGASRPLSRQAQPCPRTTSAPRSP